MCPDKATRVCEEDVCDGVEDCPKEDGEDKAFDERNCPDYNIVTFAPPTTRPTTPLPTTPKPTTPLPST